MRLAVAAKRCLHIRKFIPSGLNFPERFAAFFATAFQGAGRALRLIICSAIASQISSDPGCIFADIRSECRGALPLRQVISFGNDRVYPAIVAVIFFRLECFSRF